MAVPNMEKYQKTNEPTEMLEVRSVTQMAGVKNEIIQIVQTP